MSDETELQEYIKICDCPEIIKICKERHYNFQENAFTDMIKVCPTIDQLLEMLGGKIVGMAWYPDFVECQLGMGSQHFKSIRGQSARIALVKAVKEVKDE